MPTDDKQAELNRREVLQLGVMATASLLLPSFSKALAAGDKGLPPGQTAVAEDSALAKAVGYKKNASQVDTKAFPMRATPDGKKQFCHNCQFFVKVNGGWGTCSVMGVGVVSQKGWCSSWAKKAA